MFWVYLYRIISRYTIYIYIYTVGTYCLFGWLSVVLVRLEPNQDNRQSTKKKNKIQLCIYKVYLLMMVYKYTRNMQRLIDEIYRGQIVHQVGFLYMSFISFKKISTVLQFQVQNFI